MTVYFWYHPALIKSSSFQKTLLLLGECRTLWGEHEKGNNVAQCGCSFVPSLNGHLFPLPLLVSLKRGLTVGHTCSLKETEWGRTIGTHGGGNGMRYEWPVEPAALAACDVWTDILIKLTSVGLAHTRSNIPIATDVH